MAKIDKSLELWHRATQVIPRGTQTMSKAPNQFVFGVHPIYLERGKGCQVQDADGNWYIDYLCALGPIILGYDNKAVIKAVIKQIKKGASLSLMHPLEVELAELVCSVVPCADMVRFAKNGTDADLACVRIARSYTGREYILKPEGHYHGWGDWHAAATTRDYGVPKALKGLVETFPYNDLDLCREKLKTGKFAALIMEPVSLVEPAPGFLEGVRQMCTEFGTVLIFDEVITGFRWGLGGAQEYFGVTPDLTAMGKAAANGMPISIIAGRKEFMGEFDHIFFSSTFGGEICSLAAAVATIKQLRDNREKIYSRIWDQGDKIAAKFNRCAATMFDGSACRMFGMGPRHNISFDGAAKFGQDPGACKDLFHQEMIKQGVLFGSQIYINWSHKDKYVEKTMQAIEKSLRLVHLAIQFNEVEDLLEGVRSNAVFKKEIAGKEK